jgi:hypothetical protein
VCGFLSAIVDATSNNLKIVWMQVASSCLVLVYPISDFIATGKAPIVDFKFNPGGCANFKTVVAVDENAFLFPHNQFISAAVRDDCLLKMRELNR